jgi:hypothetical protein
MADYEVEQISETKIVDVFKYKIGKSNDDWRI